MSFPQHILVIENESKTRRFLSSIFQQNEVKEAAFCSNPDDVMKHLDQKRYDLILIDIDSKMGVDSVDLAKEILNRSFYPIVFISGVDDRAYLQKVLELSPFGFLFKPFSPKDISISLQLAYHNYQQIEREARKQATETHDVITINDTYVYDRNKRLLYRHGKPVKLNQRQERTIDCLCSHIDTTVSYEKLSLAIWNEYRTEGSILRTLIYTIRKKLPDLPLVSYSKVGYAIQSQRSA